MSAREKRKVGCRWPFYLDRSFISISRSARDSQLSGLSNLSENGEFHFQLVFFDVLYVDGRSLLHEPYMTRRAELERLIRPVQGWVRLVDSVCIDFGRPCDPSAQSAEQLQGLAALQKHLAKSLASREEGLVIKAADGCYESGLGTGRAVWAKLKKDYIPGLGDTLDFAIIGASWDRDRARELRVPCSCLTTFYVGCLGHCPSEEDKAMGKRQVVNSFFTVSYGMSRKVLVAINREVTSRSTMMYSEAVSNHACAHTRSADKH